MAAKKIPSIDDALDNFKNVMKRASLEEYLYMDRIMLSKNKKDQSILIIPEFQLWNKITDDKELIEHIKGIDVNSPDKGIFNYGEDLINGWLDIDPMVIYNGSVFKINIDSFVYEFLINKNMIPLKLRKAEVNNISYKVFVTTHVLAIKKKFEFPVEGGSFSIMRLMQIL